MPIGHTAPLLPPYELWYCVALELVCARDEVFYLEPVVSDKNLDDSRKKNTK